MPKVGKVINDMFDVKEDKEHRIQLCLKKPINTHRIAQHWDTIQRIAVSLKQRKTTQATLVRKLSEYKRNHPLLEALTEYNRLVKANYLLCYIDDASLRNYVQRALNRGEAYHQLRRAVSSVNGDQFRGSSDEEIQLWNECARWSPMPSFTSTPDTQPAVDQLRIPRRYQENRYRQTGIPCGLAQH